VWFALPPAPFHTEYKVASSLHNIFKFSGLFETHSDRRCRHFGKQSKVPTVLVVLHRQKRSSFGFPHTLPVSNDCMTPGFPAALTHHLLVCPTLPSSPGFVIALHSSKLSTYRRRTCCHCTLSSSSFRSRKGLPSDQMQPDILMSNLVVRGNSYIATKGHI
jgi:hypothetical protein